MNDKSVSWPMENNTATRMCSPESSNESKLVANLQPHTTFQSQHVCNQNSPVHTQSIGRSPGVHSPDSTPQTSHQDELFNRAINYVDKVKNRFQEQPHIYEKFLYILYRHEEYQRNLKDGDRIVTEAEVYPLVAKLFQNHDDLLQEYRQFLPDAIRAAASALVDLASNHSQPVANSQPHTNFQREHAYSRNSLAHTLSSVGLPGVASTSKDSYLVAFNHAINYINEVKNRFQEQPHIYKQFLDILRTHQELHRNLNAGFCTSTTPLTEAEVYARFEKLFQNQDDWLQEFAHFLGI